MSRNYPAIHYIQNQMKEFAAGFVDCVVRYFNIMDKNQEPDGCLSNSVALFICAKEYGYDPVLCYGLCEFEQKEFYHAWLEINDTVIDVSIYGNVNFGSYSLWDKIDKPYVGSYEDSFIHYGRFKFDEDWPYAMIAKMEGWSFEKYMNGLPQHAMWRLVCMYLNKTFTMALMNRLKTYIENESIEREENA